MQTVATQHRVVIVRALRPFMSGEKFTEPGDEVQVAFVDARYLEHTGKAQILSDAPQLETQPAADEKPAKKGKIHA